MKILCVADTVTRSLLEPNLGGPAIEEIDLVIACGDLPPEYLSSLRNRYNAPLYYVLGNHDLRYQNSPPVGCTHIDRHIVNFSTLSMTGFSGSRWYNGGINQYSEKQMRGFMRRMRFQLWRNKGVDIVVTHAPPRFVHDAEDPCHRGFRIFRWFIDKYKPRYCLHGHIHTHFEDDSERITSINSTSVINCYGYYVLEI
ncbi:MAG: metallophosphoesterase [Desulfotalea sp.]|nr:MAG: metallophosphoesterase [Desulfotalea sp.]